MLPSSGAIDFVRRHDFAGSFSWDRLTDLKKLQYERNGPEHEFLDPDLETLRQDLLKSTDSLLMALATYAFSVGENIFRVPKEWEIEKPSLLRKTVDEIHRAADNVCTAYDTLVRSARQRLLNRITICA